MMAKAIRPQNTVGAIGIKPSTVETAVTDGSVVDYTRGESQVFIAMAKLLPGSC